MATDAGSLSCWRELVLLFAAHDLRCVSVYDVRIAPQCSVGRASKYCYAGRKLRSSAARVIVAPPFGLRCVAGATALAWPVGKHLRSLCSVSNLTSTSLTTPTLRCICFDQP